MGNSNDARALSAAQIEQFITDGFVCIPDAFFKADAAEARDFLWRQTGCDPNDPGTWTRPVIRLNGFGGPLFDRVANTPVLHQAFDQLVGQGRWERRGGIGSFPIRFPHADDPGDTGWHVDVSFTLDPANATDFLSWRVNCRSRGRALLMLFLFSDVGEEDAPTRIRVGSHLKVARLLEPFGEEGLSLLELPLGSTSDCAEALATGEPGTVYLCHPFLVHAAQRHRGTMPKFMAQPPLLPRGEMALHRPDGAYCPVEQAIRAGLSPETLARIAAD